MWECTRRVACVAVQTVPLFLMRHTPHKRKRNNAHTQVVQTALLPRVLSQEATARALAQTVCVCVYVYVRMYVCLCVVSCVFVVFAPKHTHTHTRKHAQMRYAAMDNIATTTTFALVHSHTH